MKCNYYKIKKSIELRSYYYFISIMIMASAFLPIVHSNIRFIANDIGWSVLWFFSLIVFKPHIFKNKLFLFVIIYCIILFILFNTIWVHVDAWNTKQVSNECYELILATSVLAYFRTEQDYYRFAKLVKWGMIFIIITAIMTIITSFIYPMYIRNITGITAIKSKSEVDTIISYGKYGGGDYGYACSLLGIFPVLIYYVKRNAKSIIKSQYILIIIMIILFALLRTQIFANILIALIIIILCISGSKNIKNNIIITSIIVGAIMCIPMQYYKEIIIDASNWFSSKSNIHFKIYDIVKYLNGNYEDTYLNCRST